MIWKALYDFSTPTWQSYERVLFVEADTLEQAQTLAGIAAAEAEPQATITRVDVTASSASARTAYQLKVEAMELWKQNTARGIPNPRRLL